MHTHTHTQLHTTSPRVFLSDLLYSGHEGLYLRLMRKIRAAKLHNLTTFIYTPQSLFPTCGWNGNLNSN